MNNKFDELAKGMAQSVTRRGALKQFGVGLAGIALASLGLQNGASAAANKSPHCEVANGVYTGKCVGPPTIFACSFYYTTNCNPGSPSANHPHKQCGDNYLVDIETHC